MFANTTNSSSENYFLYGGMSMNDTAWQEWLNEHCYGEMSDEQEAAFLMFEKIVGGYFNCTFGTLGLIGNVLSIIVLCRKEMRKNCFSQLLIGKFYIFP